MSGKKFDRLINLISCCLQLQTFSRQLHPDDIEGEEAGAERVDAEEEIKFTPFNMKEELEDGHFDEFGHYNLNKKDERHLDNWLEDIDWVKIKKDEEYRKKYYAADGEYSSDSDDEKMLPPKIPNKFDSQTIFKEIISFMQPKEDINKTLQRLNKSKMKITTAQRWKMKKQGIVDDASEQITKLTGLTNEILTKTGNMNVYDLTYEQIQLKIKNSTDNSGAGSSKAVELDMYADDFEVKEKETKVDPKPSLQVVDDKEPELMWEFKIKVDDEKIQGPFTTYSMSKKAENGEFKDGAVARKVGDERFYSASRIDFELYL